MKKLSLWCFGLVFLLASCEEKPASTVESGEVAWPEVTKEAKPWTRWWWHGSAVDEKGLSESLQSYSEVGLGGVEITAIYGVKGKENQYLSFLSEGWKDRFAYTLETANDLGLGVDLANASGWPFGGPWVEEDISPVYFSSEAFLVEGGEQVSKTIEYIQQPILRMQDGKKLDVNELSRPLSSHYDFQEYAFDQVRFKESLPVISVTAHKQEPEGFSESIDITDRLVDGLLKWKAPEGKWLVCALFEGLHGKRVERAGPGGEGRVIDHFSKKALNNYLNEFDQAFANRDLKYLRYYFNDSYEVDDANGEANWTTEFFSEFENINGYDLREYIPALLGYDSEEMNSRIIYDYRNTISELLLENFTKPWQQWAQAQGKGIRNQAHGSPANVLDLYGSSDVPEIEGRELIHLKSAPSAANVTGKRLVSSETATWLDEHFQSNLGDIKNAVDKMFLAGVNHVFYHGTSYSPKSEPWPGWLFYAAVHLTPSNSLWDDFKTLNQYVSRAQSFLQAGSSANDILVYFNLADYWSDRGDHMLKHLHSNTLFDGISLKESGVYLSENGYSWDAISDKQLLNVTYQEGEIHTTGNKYKTVLIPESNQMPYETFEKLLEIADSGATVLFFKDLPKAAPGLRGKNGDTQKMIALKNTLSFENIEGTRVANIGEGRVVVADKHSLLMKISGLNPEAYYAKGLESVKRRKADGNYYYFLKNTSDTVFDDWISLNAEFKSAALYNPMTGKDGYATIQNNGEANEIYLKLEPNETLVVETFKREYKGDKYPYFVVIGAEIPLLDWNVDFVKGGPVLPDSFTMSKLNYWTTFGSKYESFSGTAQYETTIPPLGGKPDAWLLKLENVKETAAVFINENYVGTLINPPFEIEIPGDSLEGESNTLRIEVSNLMANRIAFLDREGVDWKKFYNINFAARKPENRNALGLFSAEKWEPTTSGLSGVVSLTPLGRK